jgi:hypothetical protein
VFESLELSGWFSDQPFPVSTNEIALPREKLRELVESAFLPSNPKIDCDPSECAPTKIYDTINSLVLYHDTRASKMWSVHQIYEIKAI